MSWSELQKAYIDELNRCILKVESQAELVSEISKKIYNSLLNDGVLHVFGSGHSHMLAEELFHRAGGLVPVNALLEEYLMPHATPKRVAQFERQSGVASAILNSYTFKKNEVLLIASNSGINPVSVELCMGAKKLGLHTVAITSLNHSESVESRHHSKLYEVADDVIDTGVVKGDASVDIKINGIRSAPLSGITTLFIGEILILRVIEMYTSNNKIPPVFKSANLPDGDSHNKSLEEKYKKRIRLL